MDGGSANQSILTAQNRRALNSQHLLSDENSAQRSQTLFFKRSQNFRVLYAIYLKTPELTLRSYLVLSLLF